MKKLLFFTFSCLFFLESHFLCFGLNLGANSDTQAFTTSETTTYAKASANCTLYKSASMEDTYSNIYFIIPETYFMSVLEIVSDTIMLVNYNDYVGYVYQTDVVIATFIPIVKTLDGITFDIKSTSGTQVWQEPTSSSNVLTTIPAGTKSITYIAFTYGDIPSGGESNIWYYVTYTPKTSSTSVYEGYVYSENTTALTEIVANTETNPEVISSETDESELILVSPTIKTLLIALISIPIIVFLAIILLKLVKMMRNFKQKRVNFAENENAENFENGFVVSSNYGDHSLKNQIETFKNNSFVRKKNEIERHPKNYPIFPSYDPDDDLL